MQQQPILQLIDSCINGTLIFPDKTTELAGIQVDYKAQFSS